MARDDIPNVFSSKAKHKRPSLCSHLRDYSRTLLAFSMFTQNPLHRHHHDKDPRIYSAYLHFLATGFGTESLNAPSAPSLLHDIPCTPVANQ
jgi:hypothetical protein